MKEALKHQPFTDESVGRRQGGDRDGTDEKAGPGPGHPTQEAAILFHVAGMRGVEQGTSSEKQQGLEDGMIDRMIETGDHSEYGQLIETIAVENHACSDARAE